MMPVINKTTRQYKQKKSNDNNKQLHPKHKVYFFEEKN